MTVKLEQEDIVLVSLYDLLTWSYAAAAVGMGLDRTRTTPTMVRRHLRVRLWGPKMTYCTTQQ